MRYDVKVKMTMEYSMVEEADSAVIAQAIALSKIGDSLPQATDTQVVVVQGVN